MNPKTPKSLILSHYKNVYRLKIHRWSVILVAKWFLPTNCNYMVNYGNLAKRITDELSYWRTVVVSLSRTDEKLTWYHSFYDNIIICRRQIFASHKTNSTQSFSDKISKTQFIKFLEPSFSVTPSSSLIVNIKSSSFSSLSMSSRSPSYLPR